MLIAYLYYQFNYESLGRSEWFNENLQKWVDIKFIYILKIKHPPIKIISGCFVTL